MLDPRDPRPAVRAVLADWLSLQAHLAFAPAEAAARLARDPDPRAVLRAAGGAPLPAAVAEATRQALARLGIRALPLGAPEYPERLRRLPDAAPLLLVRGDVAALAAPAVAIVGARAATAYGRRVAERLAAALARAGRVVVSGLARGIDAAAHRAALAAGGRSVAVLGCGPDLVYPPEHRSLAARLAEAGAVLSEFPLGTPPRAGHFPLRNRLISGLAQAVIVVEARERSGSLVTARLALDQGSDVFAVPGPIDEPTSGGTNRLLYDGATPVLGVEWLLEELGCAPVPAEPSAAPAAGAAVMPVELRSAAPRCARLRRLLDALAGCPLTPDELGRRLGCSASALAAELSELELEGRVFRERDGRLRVVGPGATRL